MSLPKTVNKFLEFGEFLIKIPGNRAASRKHIKLKFYFVGNYRKKHVLHTFFFEFISLSFFLMPEMIAQDRNYLFPLKILVKSFSFPKPHYFMVYPDLYTCYRIFF